MHALTLALSSHADVRSALTVSCIPRPSRLPEETLTLESTGGTEQYGEEFMATLRSLSDAASSEGDASAALSSDELGYAERMSQLTINEMGVAKVVPEKVYAVAVHPSSSKLLVACGDKRGNLGLWNVDEVGEDTSGVLNWQPHTAVINWLQFNSGGSKLYSSSYDGQCGCADAPPPATGLKQFSHTGAACGRRVRAWLHACVFVHEKNSSVPRHPCVLRILF